MEHRTAHAQKWQRADEQNFTGRAFFGPMTPLPEPGDINMTEVLFEPGARTDWHSHPGGQALYVVTGSGVVQNESGHTVRVGPGDVVYAPPGEVHWHGAGRDSFMVHFSVTAGGPTEWTNRKVSDEQYHAT